MKTIMFFNIPSHGHTNPTLPIVKELIKRKYNIRYYSFDYVKEDIEKTGATYISLDEYLDEEAKVLASRTEMTLKDIVLTENIDDMIANDIATYHPTLLVTDSMCYWGKLIAQKYDIPMVVSTKTFAMNKSTRKYLRHSAAQIADVVVGMPKMALSLRKLKPLGYDVRNPMRLIGNDDETDTIVYTSLAFQPMSETFNEHYKFVGPSVDYREPSTEEKDKPLIYISLGSLVEKEPDTYHNIIEGLKDINADVIITTGHKASLSSFGPLPDNVKLYDFTDQMDVLSKADVFITHCGLGSVSEGLYMGVPLALYPKTVEERAVAKRTVDLRAGAMLDASSPRRVTVTVNQVLNNDIYKNSALNIRNEFIANGGAEAAVDFIESIIQRG